MTEIQNAEIEQLLTAAGGRDLTADELQNLMEMFVAEKTCAEREKTILAGIERWAETDEVLRTTLAAINDKIGDHETRVGIIEESRSQSQKRTTTKIAIGVLALGIISNLDTIASVIKSLSK